MNTNLEYFDPRDTPQTKKMIQMKQEAAPPIVNFVWKFLVVLKKKNNQSEIQMTYLFEKYQLFCEDTNSTQKYGCFSTFSKKLKRSIPFFKSYVAHSKKSSILHGYNGQDIDDTIKVIEMKYLFEPDIAKYTMTFD